MNNEKRSIFSVFENCVDILINFITIFAGYMLTLVFFDPLIIISDYSALFSIFIILIFSMPIYQFSQVYRKIPYVGKLHYIHNITKANLLVSCISLLFFPMFCGAEKSKFIFCWVAISFVLSTFSLIFKKRMMISVVRSLRRKHHTVRKIIIVGDNADSANAFAKQVAENSDTSMMVIGVVGNSMKANMVCDNLGDFENLAEILDRYKPDDVVFAIDAYNKANLISLVNMCDDRCIKVYFLPVIYGFFKTIRQVERVGNLPIINIHSTPLDSRFNQFIKRVCDIVISLSLIVITAPVMLAVAIGVRLSSDGPVLFRQERVGKLGKPFTMFKFRSMHVTSTQNNTWTTPDDPRRTRFGAFLRRSSLDELPQLFNVLIGDMSIIGPRPEVPHFVEHFKNEVPLYMVKHYVKPGITGLAQVRGLRGNTPVEERISADIAYIENWSILMDLSILLRTPFKAYNSSEKYVDSAKLDEEADNDVMFDFSTMRPKPAPSAYDIIRDGEKKKILYCASRMVHINNFHKDYIAALRAGGNDVCTLAHGDGADFNVPFEKKIFSKKNFGQIKRIRKIILDGKFDVVVLNTSLAAFFVRLALPRKGRPRVINFVHGYLFSKHIHPMKAKMLMLCERMLKSRTDDIIVMNTQDYRTAVTNRLCLERVFFVRGMGAEVREMITPPKKLRAEHKCEDKYVMTFVGELSARKNQTFLIKCLPKIKHLIPEAVLWLVGDGAARETLIKQARELGVQDSVMLMGSRADACDFVRASNLYVSASSIEGMPFNIIEALGLGVPIVASKVKGHIDIIADRTDGCLYNFNNLDDFITKVYKIYTGTVKISKENMISKYRKYTKDSVFKDTFSVLVCAVTGVKEWSGDTAPLADPTAHTVPSPEEAEAETLQSDTQAEAEITATDSAQKQPAAKEDMSAPDIGTEASVQEQSATKEDSAKSAFPEL